MDKFTEYVNGKSVAIVGPAKSAEGSGNGNEIDSFDIVCRLNAYSAKMPESDFGTKRDVLFVTPYSNYDIKGIKEAGFVWIVSPHNLERSVTKELYRQCNENSLSFSCPPAWLWPEICKDLNRYPTTGLMAAIYLMTLPVKTLTMFAMDFHNSGYAQGYGTKKMNKEKFDLLHDTESQIRYLSLMEDKRLSFDSVLGELIRPHKEGSGG